ncbi:NmrA/HSCARG family protein [Ramlibacter sp.]
MTLRTITVFGATGAQGGGLARALLADKERRFAVRAVTRQPDAPRAAALRTLGAEVVAADLDDAASVAAAMQGAWGAYCVTNYWEHHSPARELAQARALAQGAAAAGVRHVVWSTLEDTRRVLPADGRRMPVLLGSYNVPHFDANGEADALFRAAGLPCTLLRTSFYWDNFIHFGMGPRANAQGALELVLPLGAARLPGIAAEDIGRCALGIFRDPDTWIGRTVGVAGEHLDGDAMARELGQALGRPVAYRAIAPAEYRALGFPGADDLGNMFQFKVDHEAAFRRARDVEASRRLHPGLQSFAQWLAAHRGAIPLS